ncbi:MAG: class I SAM-dependent methyltransferase [Verrucomicrobia bacterium]|nr:class I SAM-dependent methyltransferase [Verrucomicrobiota bacterium]
MIGWAHNILSHLVAPHSIGDHLQQIIQLGDCRTALDIGCGPSSFLNQFRPNLRTVGLDAFEGAIAEARRRGQHDDYVLADILTTSPEAILERAGGRPFDLVTLFDVIEHFPRRQGLELLERCERLTSKFVVVHTPNGFLPQGPEYGNEFQRHLSGWFPCDFEGMAYTVHGTTGAKMFRGYAAGLRYNFPGAASCDVLLAGLLRIEKRPQRAFSLLAVKDVRGEPVRMGACSNSKPAAS